MKPFLHKAPTFAFFCWNVDQSVGLRAQNGSACDVSYIQWYYTLAAVHILTPPDRKAIYSRVLVTGVCNGSEADPLVAAITAHQRGIDHPIVDGKISVAHGDGKIDAKAFFILRLGARVATMYPDLWPRLDLMPRCPQIVARAVKDAIPCVTATFGPTHSS
jgi:hypothetical protein